MLNIIIKGPHECVEIYEIYTKMSFIISQILKPQIFDWGTENSSSIVIMFCCLKLNR